MFEIVLAPGAVKAMRGLPAYVRGRVGDGLERHRRHEPRKVTKSRIKRLRGLNRPQYRLRVDEIRVFYDVTETTVEVLAIVSKDAAQAWREREGTSEAGGGAGQS